MGCWPQSLLYALGLAQAWLHYVSHTHTHREEYRILILSTYQDHIRFYMEFLKRFLSLKIT